MSYEQELEAQWQKFTADVKAAGLERESGLLNLALNSRNVEIIKFCLVLCQDASGLAKKIPPNGRFDMPPAGPPGTENHLG